MKNKQKESPIYSLWQQRPKTQLLKSSLAFFSNVSTYCHNSFELKGQTWDLPKFHYFLITAAPKITRLKASLLSEPNKVGLK